MQILNWYKFPFVIFKLKENQFECVNKAIQMHFFPIMLFFPAKCTHKENG